MLLNQHKKSVTARIAKDVYKTDITLDTHALIADEPPDNGGLDLGPSPGDFLRISLASCTAITLRMYANRKGYNIDEIAVKVESERINGKTIFYCNIQLTGNVTEAEKNRMVQIAKACPVHKSLTNPIEILTQLK